MPINGLRCPQCELTEDDVFYSLAAGPPACPDCGGERTVWWGHGHAPGLFSDEKPSIKLGQLADARMTEMASTRNGQEQLRRELEAQHPGKRVEFEPPSHARRVEWEERKQRTIDYRKASGVDMKEFEEKRQAKRRAAKEAKEAALKKGASEGQAATVAKEAAAKAVTK